jgi:hypothetical protein
MKLAVVIVFLLSAVPRAEAALPKEAVAALWVTAPATHGEIPGHLPARFVLFEDGRVFVGGTAGLFTARLEKRDLKEVDKHLARVRKMSGLTAPVTLGPGEQQYRLWLRKGTEVLAKGDPAQAPAALKSLAALLETLAGFTHPELQPYVPESFVVSVLDQPLEGGCRDWQWPVRLSELRKAPATVPASAAAGWPTGGYPASVCEGDRTYTVLLRPLLPGETF